MRMQPLKKAYIGPAKLVAQYWKTYGSWRGFALSPYFHCSILLSAITYGVWSERDWWEQVLTVVPSLLGFSLGALAIFLGFGSERFRDVISGRRPDATDKASPYMEVTAAFTHFIVVQVGAVLLAVVCGALFKLVGPGPDSVFYEINRMLRVPFWAFAYWFFLYALCLAAASVFAIFRVASWFDAHRTKEREHEARTNEVGSSSGSEGN